MPEKLGRRYLRTPARVLSCLRNGVISVIVCPGSGLADGGIPIDLPVEIIPVDLRMPNSEFDVMLDLNSGDCVTVLRKNEPDPDTGQTTA